ncbi:MAG: hypothetical protein LW650_03240 [Planctomycetaceae bacterium]|jgi:hypothetical protein|nr:hypothetical protein [Phycisphaerales bacterium]MCE2652531.1 hypothetical protein [Planctomycetaceae bacterium]
MNTAMRHSGWRRVAMGAGAAAVSLLGGCGPSVWEANYRPADEVRVGAGPAVTPLAEGAAVEIREVPWARIDASMKRIEERLAASAVHVSEWTAEQRGELKGELLSGLQTSEPAGAVSVLGRSSFRSTDPVSPDDADLAKYARRLGANRVVWAKAYTGKADRIVRESVTTNSVGWWDTYSRPYPDRRWENFSTTSTVPVRIAADEYAWLAFFLHVHAR